MQRALKQTICIVKVITSVQNWRQWYFSRISQQNFAKDQSISRLMIAWKIEGCGPHYPTNSPPRLTPQGAQYGSSNKTVHCESATISGFHTTSPKFKLRNYRFFWVLLSWGITAPKNLYLHKFLVPKGFSLCVRGRFQEFPDFCVTWHLAGGRQSSYGG